MPSFHFSTVFPWGWLLVNLRETPAYVIKLSTSLWIMSFMWFYKTLLDQKISNDGNDRQPGQSCKNVDLICVIVNIWWICVSVILQCSTFGGKCNYSDWKACFNKRYSVTSVNLLLKSLGLYINNTCSYR